MTNQSHFDETASFFERFAAEAQRLRAQAVQMPDGADRAAVLNEAAQFDSATHKDGYLRSSELTPPKR